jgi:hypothetical protein
MLVIWFESVGFFHLNGTLMPGLTQSPIQEVPTQTAAFLSILVVCVNNSSLGEGWGKKQTKVGF